MDVRVLTGPGGLAGPGDGSRNLTDDDLAELYRAPGPAWWRVNMVSTLDGAGTGDDGRSGGINNTADHRVFDCLRRLCDAVLVGAGTARAEGYVPLDRPLVLVSRRGDVPDRLTGAAPGAVWLVTCADAEHLDRARALLGPDQVLVTGRDRVDLVLARKELAARGFAHVLSEGGPHLLRDLVAAGVLDELDLTVVPRLLGGVHPRIVEGPPVDARLTLRLLLEDDGTLLMRWTR